MNTSFFAKSKVSQARALVPALTAVGLLGFFIFSSCSNEKSNDPATISPNKNSTAQKNRKKVNDSNLSKKGDPNTTGTQPAEEPTAGPTTEPTTLPTTEPTTLPTTTGTVIPGEPTPVATEEASQPPSIEETKAQVLQLSQTYCATCHGPGGRAAFLPLTTIDEILENKVGILERVASVDSPMPPKRSAEGKAMTAEQKAAMLVGVGILTP